MRHPDRGGCLGEYVDALHFLVSVGTDLGYKSQTEDLMKTTYQTGDITEQLILLNYLAGTPHPLPFPYIELFQAFMGLGEMCGFTNDEIYAAYREKNRVNHRRQRFHY